MKTQGKPKDAIKRYLVLEGTEDVLEISRVTAINSPLAYTILAIERLPDGTHRLTYNSTVIPDLRKIEGFRLQMVREGPVEEGT